MKSFKKIFLMLTSFAMVVGTLLIGGGIKKTESVEAGTENGSVSGTWNLVTDANDLAVGDQIVIASNTNGTVAGDISSSVMQKISATFSADKTTITELPSTAVILTLGGSAGKWTLANANRLLGATAVKKLAWGDGTTTWSISISSNDATIQNGTESYGRFLYNANSKQERFTPYTSSTSDTMVLPQIYRFTDETAQYTVSFIDSDVNKTPLSKTQTANKDNGFKVTKPVVTRDNYTLEGWYLEDGNTSIKWNFDNRVQKDMILVAHWESNDLINAKKALDSVTSYMSYGFKYNMTSSPQEGCYLATENTLLDGKEVVIVAKYSGSYFAMSDTQGSKRLNGTKLEGLTNINEFDIKNFSTIADSITWKANTYNGGYSLKSESKNSYVHATSSSTDLTLGNISKFNIISSKGYTVLSVSDSRSIVYRNSYDFRNYNTSNIGASGYASEMYVFVVNDIRTVNTYSDVYFRLKCGINDTSLTGVTLPEGASYGIEVSTGARTVKYEITRDLIHSQLNPNDTTPTKYVIIDLGDVINNIERATTEFTTRAYLKFGENEYYYSNEVNPENKKTYSVASLTENAYNANENEVLDLYMLFEEKGCYAAA